MDGRQTDHYYEDVVTTSAAVVAGIFVLLILLRLVVYTCRSYCRGTPPPSTRARGPANAPTVFIVRGRGSSLDDARPFGAPPTYDEALGDNTSDVPWSTQQPLVPGPPPIGWVAPAPLVPYPLVPGESPVFPGASTVPGPPLNVLGPPPVYPGASEESSIPQPPSLAPEPATSNPI